jgi:hypothetical protein
MNKKKLYGMLKTMAASGTPDVFGKIKSTEASILNYDDVTKVREYQMGRRIKRVAFPLKAAVSLLIAAVLYAGVFYLPSVVVGQKVDKSHDFELVAYATVEKGKTVSLKQDMKVTLPIVQFSGGSYGGTGFLCTGKNLVSVKYTAKNGLLDYTSTGANKNELDGFKKSIVCIFAIPVSDLEYNYGGVSDIQSYDDIPYITRFNNLWNSGKLDKYRKKYFKGGNIDLNRFYVTIDNNGRLDSEGKSTWCDLSIEKTIKKPNCKSAIVIIQDSTKIKFNVRTTSQRKSIEAKASDHNADVGWYLSSKTYLHVNAAVRHNKKFDYSTVPGDTITITGTFSDGQKLTKYLVLSFNKTGRLCAKLTEK